MVAPSHSRANWRRRLLSLAATIAILPTGLSAFAAIPEDPFATQDATQSGPSSIPQSGEVPTADPDPAAPPLPTESAEPAASPRDHLPIQGTVVALLSTESGDGNAPAKESAQTRVRVITDEGLVIPIDPALLDQPLPLSSGQRISATLIVPPEAPVVSVDDAEYLQMLADWARENDMVFTLKDVQTPSLSTLGMQALRPAVKSHTVDIVYLASEQAGPPDSYIDELITDAFEYWRTQTDGVVAGVTPGFEIRRIDTDASVACDLDKAWDLAAAQFGKTQRDYLNTAAANSSLHLIVLVDDPACTNAAGVATVGKTIHGGGEVWVNAISTRIDGNLARLGQYSLGTLSHEIGHNFGLGHGYQRSCTKPAFDASAAQIATGNPCHDVEYGDWFNVMGVSPISAVPLPTAQRDELGVAPAGSIRTISSSDGSHITVDLKPLTATSGVRGLKVISPNPGEVFYVEYRDDVRGIYDNNATMNRGVRVLKSFKDGGPVGIASSVIGHWASDGRLDYALLAGDTLMPYGNTAVLTVNSITSSGATVTIDFATPVPMVTAPNPTISGNTALGSTLTAQTGAWWPTPQSFSYQWLRDGAPIAGATGSTYVVTAADAGRRISVTVTSQLNGYAATARTSAELTVPGAPTPQYSWVQSGGNWYYMSQTGEKKTGWLYDGAWYYLRPTGVMATGWELVGGTWYYLRPNGAMATGWQQISGSWYYLNSSGAMQTGWLNLGGTWYYMSSNGAMQTGWVKLGNTWYYFTSAGNMVIGRQWIGGRWYTFASSGAWLGY